MDVTVRSYEPRDRDAVRDVCYRTGYMGDSPEWYWRDRESFADMWTHYYTDDEPASALVAERDGLVEGYLLGCVDSRQAVDPTRLALHHAVRRLCLARRGTAGVMWRTMADVVRDHRVGGMPLPVTPFDEHYPSHLHIDLMPSVRGAGVGRRLVDGFLERLTIAGSPGCYLETLAENTTAVAFFGACGFEVHGAPVLVPGLRTRHGGRLHMLRMRRSAAG